MPTKAGYRQARFTEQEISELYAEWMERMLSADTLGEGAGIRALASQETWLGYVTEVLFQQTGRPSLSASQRREAISGFQELSFFYLPGLGIDVFAVPVAAGVSFRSRFTNLFISFAEVLRTVRDDLRLRGAGPRRFGGV